jgi:Flp pilus assembly protein TadD
VIGRAELAEGDLSGAIASFKKAIELVPDHGYALNNLGYALLRANLNDEAVDVLEHAAEILPNVAYVHNNLGVAYERVGREEEAEAEYTRSASLSPKYVKAQVNSARMKRLASAVSPTDKTNKDKVPTPSDINDQ